MKYYIDKIPSGLVPPLRHSLRGERKRAHCTLVLKEEEEEEDDKEEELISALWEKHTRDLKSLNESTNLALKRLNK